jgi:hypothetical protein
VAKYDAFISYSHADKEWVTAFAERLQREGLKIAYDSEFITAGDLLVIEIEEAIRSSATGILVFSSASAASNWVKNEYATLMKHSIETGRRFIPVLIDDVDLPEFAAAHDDLFNQVVEAVRSPRTGGLQGTARRPGPNH